jgi:hypothetical protein
MRFDIGPNLVNVSTRAATRIEGMTASEYLHESITHPGRYLVTGFRGAMPADFAEHYSDQDIDDLVAYLMTL